MKVSTIELVNAKSFPVSAKTDITVKNALFAAIVLLVNIAAFL